MGQRLRVVIADDHPMFREGVNKTLTDLANCDVVAECANADGAFDAVSQHLPDVVLLDVSMPGNGIEAARRISAAFPTVRILMLTVSENERDVVEALGAGASGYVLKGVGGEELATVVRSVYGGDVYVSPGLAARLLVDSREQKKERRVDPFSDLTAREEQILKKVSRGLSNKEIARELSLSEKTVKHYMTNVLQKLQVRNRVEAAIKAREYFAGDGPER